jgi:hypothetical protein
MLEHKKNIVPFLFQESRGGKVMGQFEK